jgi:ubiquinol-cytochrome c reductase iron-sulfur subunit
MKLIARSLGRRCFSTAPAQFGGLAVAQLRQEVGSPAAKPKPTVKLPPYLKPSQLRPQRGCFSDQFVVDTYVRSAVKDGSDASGDRGRLFTYFVKANLWATGIATSRVAILFALSMWAPNKSTQALANIEVDVGDIPEGKTVTIMWRGKPVFIRHRTDEEIATEAAVNIAELRDPQTDAERLPYPKWAVFVGVCTHLGCVPVVDEGAYGAYLCPCHCAAFDHSGRIRRGPAPLNLEVPPHKLLDENTIFIGDLSVLKYRQAN